MPLDPVHWRQAGQAQYLFEYSGIRIPMSVSPDGEFLAIGNFGEPHEDVFISRIDGSGLTRLTQDAFNDRGLAWAPDGRSLVFYSRWTG